MLNSSQYMYLCYSQFNISHYRTTLLRSPYAIISRHIVLAASLVFRLQPMSLVTWLSLQTLTTAVMIVSAEACSPIHASISAAAHTAPIGFAMPLPMMSNALPRTGAKMEAGFFHSGSRLADAATPIEPASAAARSERISIGRFVPTTVSMLCGFCTMRIVMASTSSLSHETSGNSCAIRTVIS